MLSFLDAFFGYHQNPMHPPDKEKTVFITPHELYCSTYQWLMTKIFKPLIGHTVEVYIDDIVVKIFYLLREYCMKLNPSKCAIGGIEVNPDQIKDVMEASALSSKKKLQCLTGRLVALGRFIARFTDKLRSFFLMLRAANMTGWTEDCHVVLFRCLSDKEQRPAYYTSKAMADTETRYSKREQTTLALRIVLTNQPLKSILHKPDLLGRMMKWAIELSEYRIEYQPRLSIKGQVMANFIVERDGGLYTSMGPPTSGSGIDLLLQSPIGEHLEQAIWLGFPASNNEAEYEVILSGLNLALVLSTSKLEVCSDFQLVGHIQEEYEVKDEQAFSTHSTR
ncbi:hypothetical protein AAG906_008688 [Vitis piasezkii]